MERLTNEVKRPTSPARPDSAADGFHQGRSASDKETADAQHVVRGRAGLPAGARNRGRALAIASPMFGAAASAYLTQ
jgi:hypothetical protein